MKSFVCFIVSLVMFKAHAQTVFAPQGSEWHYFRTGEPPLYNIKFSTEKDTLYKGHYCSKVNGIKTYLDGTKEIQKTNYFYTSNDTVFYYHDSLNDFTPLYVYNVKVGDTLTFVGPTKTYGSTKFYKVVVSKLDTTIFDGIPLRTVYVNVIVPVAGYGIKWTERFGGYYVANIIAIIGPTTADHEEWLRCYHDNDIDEKFTTDTWDCDYIATSIKNQNLLTKVSIYPNPTKDKLNIELGQQLSQTQISILSIDGQVIHRYELSPKSSAINIEDLAHGIYVLRFECGNEVYVEKFVKTP